MFWSRYEETATGDHIIVGHREDSITLQPDVVIRVEHAIQDDHDGRPDMAYRIVRFLSTPPAQ